MGGILERVRALLSFFSLSLAVGVVGCGTMTPCKFGDRETCVAACADKHAPSCTRLAAMQEDNPQAALEGYVRACLLGSGAGLAVPGAAL